jgi:glycosyltransferase involved in cell wall biosynthesis
VKDLISVVVPVYNCEKYLEQCVSSLLRQDYSDIEIILIDDGATDGSGAICDRYAEQDARVRAIHKDNAGVSAARNDGIDAASGACLAFVDSDDWVEPGALGALHEALAKDGADMATLRTAVIDVDEGFELPLFTSDRPLDLSGPVPAIEVSRAFLETEPLLTSVVWGKLYRRSLFDGGLRYDVDHPYEDTRLLPLVYDRCRSISCVQGDYYHYLQRPSSAMHHKYSAADKCEFFDSRVFKIVFYYNHGLRDASYDFERWQCEANLVTQSLMLPSLDEGERGRAEMEYSRRKAWFQAQRWRIHGGRTDLELTQEGLPQ